LSFNVRRQMEGIRNLRVMLENHPLWNLSSHTLSKQMVQGPVRTVLEIFECEIKVKTEPVKVKVKSEF
jgi:hypothetical protein